MDNLAGKKVEVICAGTTDELTAKVNKFLETHKLVIDIQYQAVPRYPAIPDHAAMIIYEY